MNILFVSAYGAWKRPASYIKSQSDSLKKIGLTVTNFYFKYQGIYGYFKSFIELKKFLRQRPDYDIIHAHFGYTALFVYLTFPKSKLVISFMGDDLFGVFDEKCKQTIRGRVNIIISRFLQKKSDWNIVKSERMMNYIIPAVRNITTVIPNGVDFDKFPIMEQHLAKEKLGLNASKKYILFLGSSSDKRKNYNLLQQAYKLIKCKNVLILNPYPIEGEDVYLYLNAADVLVLTSTLEGSPNVIKEAIVCNCPIVSTDVGDVAERIKNIDGCYLSGFDEIDLAEKIDKSLNFKGRTNGRNLAGYLRAENIALQIRKIYANCCPTIDVRITHVSRTG